MIGSRYGVIAAVIAVLSWTSCGASSASSEEAVSGDQNAAEDQAASPDAQQGGEEQGPRAPLRLDTVDFQDTGDGSGNLKLAGIALPGKELYLFLDDQPFANVLPDDGGNWSIEKDMKLDTGRHTFRADQYDAETGMLAARAMVSIERAKQPAEDNAAPAVPPAKETTP